MSSFFLARCDVTFKLTGWTSFEMGVLAEPLAARIHAVRGGRAARAAVHW